jgi:hypothetical protein
MKNAITVIAIITALLLTTAHAENQYEITWSTIDSGGSTSTGGPYELTGTIGQHDTGVSSAEGYTLSSGFRPGSFGCVVNLTDLLVLADLWLETQDGLPADINDSGTVDFTDFSEMAYWWYDTCPADWPVK